jgi:hypothetical protein
MCPIQKVPGAPARSQGNFKIALKLFTKTKTFLIGSTKTQKLNSRGQAIQELIFPAAKTDFEGGFDGRGCFD